MPVTPYKSLAGWPLLAAGIVAFAGCARLERQGLSLAEKRAQTGRGREVEVRLHAVIARKDGLPVSASVQGDDVMFSPPMSELQDRTYLTAMINNLKAHAPTRDGKKQIMIFIHGGMNEKKRSCLTHSVA